MFIADTKNLFSTIQKVNTNAFKCLNAFLGQCIFNIPPTSHIMDDVGFQILIPTCFRSSSRDCPPQLPPRDNGIYSLGPNAHAWSNVSSNEDQEQNSRQENKKEKKKTGDDPYYFGLSARIPNFVKSRKKKQKERNRPNQGQVNTNKNSTIPFTKMQLH